MSAPDTNIEKQKSRHLPVFLGLAGVALLVLILAISFTGGADEEDRQDQVPASASDNG